MASPEHKEHTMRTPVRLIAFSLSALLVSSTMASSALAAAPLLKCVDTAGRVTLTDHPCADGTQQVNMLDASGRPIVAEHFVATAAEIPRGPLPKRPPPTANPLARPSPDVATLKAARMAMQLGDSMHQQQKVAGLN
jgi:hypothetical protein